MELIHVIFKNFWILLFSCKYLAKVAPSMKSEKMKSIKSLFLFIDQLFF